LVKENCHLSFISTLVILKLELLAKTLHCKKKELYGTSEKCSADDKKLANMFKISKKE
jgi:hypothetical protein